jgi:methyl coenzyme M reductase subunit C
MVVAAVYQYVNITGVNEYAVCIVHIQKMNRDLLYVARLLIKNLLYQLPAGVVVIEALAGDFKGLKN